jgi:hypothetical protein
MQSDLDRIMVKLPNRDWLSYEKAQLSLAKQTFQGFCKERQLFFTKEPRLRELKEWLLNLFENLPEAILLLLMLIVLLHH